VTGSLCRWENQSSENLTQPPVLKKKKKKERKKESESVFFTLLR
jgi:hypothetical protein